MESLLWQILLLILIQSRQNELLISFRDAQFKSHFEVIELRVNHISVAVVFFRVVEQLLISVCYPKQNLQMLISFKDTHSTQLHHLACWLIKLRKVRGIRHITLGVLYSSKCHNVDCKYPQASVNTSTYFKLFKMQSMIVKQSRQTFHFGGNWEQIRDALCCSVLLFTKNSEIFKQFRNFLGQVGVSCLLNTMKEARDINVYKIIKSCLRQQPVSEHECTSDSY